jgi:hypothetical protein
MLQNAPAPGPLGFWEGWRYLLLAPVPWAKKPSRITTIAAPAICLPGRAAIGGLWFNGNMSKKAQNGGHGSWGPLLSREHIIHMLTIYAWCSPPLGLIAPVQQRSGLRPRYGEARGAVPAESP